MKNEGQLWTGVSECVNVWREKSSVCKCGDERKEEERKSRMSEKEKKRRGE